MWNSDTMAVKGWPQKMIAGTASSPGLGDIDNDGQLEIVTGSDDNNVYAWNGDGTAVPGWPQGTNGKVNSSPALGDIDGDGALEIVVGSEDGNVYAWNGDGTAVSGWPRKTGSTVLSAPALVDVDMDSRLEIIVGSADDKVYAWNGDGTAVSGFPVSTYGDIVSSPAAGDLDGDGAIDIVVGSADNRVYVWEGRPGSFNPNYIAWPAFRHDAQRTGMAAEARPSNQPVFRASLTSLPFGSVTVGASGRQTFTIQNAGDAALKVTGLAVTGTDAGQFSVSPSAPFDVNPGTGREVAVTFTPTVSGSKAATLSIAHNAPGSPSSIPLTGAGAIQQPSTTLGDADGDGKVGVRDAILVLRFAAELETPTAAQKLAGDVDKDGKVGVRDAILILRFAAELITSFSKPAAAQPAPVQLAVSLSDVEHRTDGTVALTVSLDREEDAAGGDLTFTYRTAAGRASEVQVEGLSPGALSAVNTDVPGQVRIVFAQPDESPYALFADRQAGPIVLRVVLSVVQETEPLRVGLTGQLYDGWGLPIGEARLDRIVSILPSEFALSQNYPNPFNPSTAIRYDLPQAGHVALEVYNLAGQLVRRLVNEETEAGHHSVEWDGRDDGRRTVGSGIYLYRLTVDGGRFAAVRRMVFLK